MFDDRVAASDQVLTAGSDNQAQANARDLAGNVAFAQGRLDDAYEALTAAAGMISWLAPTAYLTAARAALWLRDPVRARDTLEKLDATTHGPVINAGHATIEAGLIALSGDVGGALTRYRASLEAWRELGLPVDIALTAIDMATLIGPGDPAVAAAAAEARGILTALGAQTFLARTRGRDGLCPGSGA